ncbi:unnamed protein product [Dracunculus medinensis]|uniref:SAM_MT_RSMB_NOP domain-containing protein n=1 Tax=Dracunculus medinensis TaxID=318479 RepID=A0A0N4UL27_DRAME|nr:unnamed protein product [Dracunculus medinensis]
MRTDQFENFKSTKKGRKSFDHAQRESVKEKIPNDFHRNMNSDRKRPSFASDDETEMKVRLNAKTIKSSSLIESERQEKWNNSNDNTACSSSSSSENVLDELPIEKKSRKLERKAAIEKIRSKEEEEFCLNLISGEKYNLPSIEDVEDELKLAPNLQIIKQRIGDIFEVLGDFKNRRQAGRKRKEYLAILTRDLCKYYGYNEFLMEKFRNLFSNGRELLEFLEANDQPRPLTIRSNSLKTRRGELARTLINRGMNVDPAANWTKVGLIVYESQVPVGATPEYLAGHYIVQGLSSLIPVMALAPQPNESVLDMCAAPGGKTSHIAAVMKNTGTIFANDSNKPFEIRLILVQIQRCRAIIGNLHRLGVNNAVVTNLDGKIFANIFPQAFDRVILDAPCSGTGVISKDETIKGHRDSQDIQRKHTIQRQLILAAMDSLNAKSETGGYLVYSTCSVLVEENEAVVDYLLRKRDCKLVPIGVDIGIEGFSRYREYRFHPSLNLSRRYYPHIHNFDGFFVAKIKKLSNEKSEVDNLTKFLREIFSCFF